MSDDPLLANRVKTLRAAKGWSQEELAAKAGISRPGVSAIESGRLAPSVSAALALAAALDCTVENLFQLGSSPKGEPAWAWQPSRGPCRFWRATVAGRDLLYPVEPTNLGAIGHDGVQQEGQFRDRPLAAPADTLIMASCDPAVGLLADELRRRGRFRLIALSRSSHEALRLLGQGLVHVAGIHLASTGHARKNRSAAAEGLRQDFCLLRGARWQEGLAIGPGLGFRSVRAAVRSPRRWVGREIGSAARELLDELLSGRKAPRHVVHNHRDVAAAIRCGWADVGVCLRLVSDEAGLNFLNVRQEEYDYCYPAALEGDPRLQALVEVVRSVSYRGLLGQLPGYDSTEAGELERVAAN